jgi:hypothetical protein
MRRPFHISRWLAALVVCVLVAILLGGLLYLLAEIAERFPWSGL